jgi:hypothetical protein
LGLALGCSPDFDQVTRVEDLRVLSVAIEPSQILLGPIDPTAVLPPVELRALVVDPAGAGRPVEVTAALCGPELGGDTKGRDRGGGNFRDTVGRGRCDALAVALPVTPVEGVAAGQGGQVVSARLSLSFAQIAAATGLDPSRLAGVDPKLVAPFGLPLRFQLRARAGDEEVVVIKRLDLHPRFDEASPNQSPVVTRVVARAKEGAPPTEVTADEPLPVRLGTKVLLLPEGAQAETYAAMTFDRDLGRPTLRTGIREVLRFSFFTTDGKLEPAQTNTEPEAIFTSPKIKLEATFEAPKLLAPGKPELVDLWIVVRDERAGQSFVHRRLRLVP